MFIVYGAGKTGEYAANYLGWPRIICFASSYGSQEDFYDKKVISYEDMLIKAEEENVIIVVASARYNAEMVRRLQDDGVSKFFIFHEADPVEIHSEWPGFWLYGSKEDCSYKRVLSLNNIKRFKRIAIYGDNFFLPYLISEISIQSGYDCIVGIVPTSINKTINSVGLPLITLDEAWNKIDCLIVNKRRSETDVFDIIRKKSHSFDVVHIYDVEKFIPEFHHPELKQFKDIHKGKRCFIVGNGPSLRVEDLNMLHEKDEICFGFNRVYRIFDKTKWRPAYYCAGDPRCFGLIKDYVSTMKGIAFISDVFHGTGCQVFDNVNYVHLNYEDYGAFHPEFSSDITVEIRLGNSTVYDIGLQFAAYMGFSEIYLIGCDSETFGTVSAVSNHFIENYFDENERGILKSTTMDWRSVFRAYEMAEWYSRENGFRIYNATRGGKLEVFERVDFDSLF